MKIESPEQFVEAVAATLEDSLEAAMLRAMVPIMQRIGSLERQVAELTHESPRGQAPCTH